MKPLLLPVLVGLNRAVYLVFGQITRTGGVDGPLLAPCQAGAGIGLADMALTAPGIGQLASLNPEAHACSGSAAMSGGAS